MNKLSFFTLSLAFITQISLPENAETNVSSHYTYLAPLNNKISQNCNTVEPASLWRGELWRGDLECACDTLEINRLEDAFRKKNIADLNNVLRDNPTSYRARFDIMVLLYKLARQKFATNEEIVDNMRVILADESPATKIECFNQYFEIEKKHLIKEGHPLVDRLIKP
jgi:hypothetical protein